MTLYLLDANVLIVANSDYYPMDRIPRFWDWLLEMGTSGHVKIPRQIYGEITPSKAPLAEWLKEKRVKDSLLLDEAIDAALIQKSIAQGYAPDLNDVELEMVGQDPFLVAAAWKDSADRVVVTKEVSKPSQTRGKRKLPDVCKTLGIEAINDFELYRRLRFSIR